jgi:hypothetical protein
MASVFCILIAVNPFSSSLTSLSSPSPPLGPNEFDGFFRFLVLVLEVATNAGIADVPLSSSELTSRRRAPVVGGIDLTPANELLTLDQESFAEMLIFLLT